MTSSGNHVAIIGAGPYGLAAAAHLRAANIETTIFGRALEFWKNHMPAGMLLRSYWDASHISDPEGRLTLDRYHAVQGAERATPLSRDTFINYGTWFQRQVAPDLDEQQVVRIERDGRGFRLLLEDGEAFHSRRVVIATGIASFADRPSSFDHIPPVLASHSADHCDFKAFAGKELIVLGAGQSAIESAALLNEAGSHVELVVRAQNIRWLHRRDTMRSGPFRKLLFPSTDVGPPGLNQIAARPDWFKRIPRQLQPRFAYRCIRPAGAAWLKPRVAGIRITAGHSVVSAEPAGERLSVRLDDGSNRRVDHVLLATGYRVNILRYTFLAPELARSIRCNEGYPELSAGFECSIPGLHFLGAPAAWTFGPLMRFVSGTAYAAQELVRCVLENIATDFHSRRPQWLVTARS
ncbi:MAG TPA: FAD-dependent oxidoreductase [Terriglobia bacterium]|nr:FAD-dependent oxidoreductase [Terriglobia bacterium]